MVITGRCQTGGRRVGSPGRVRGFSIVELLVVIGIIAAVAGILLPVLAKARESARQVQCASNLRQLIHGIACFAADHQNVLPGAHNDFRRPDPSQRDWLAGGSTDWHTGPRTGTLYEYVEKNDAVYRCPSLEVLQHNAAASNGKFDYAFFCSLAGARLSAIRPVSRYTWPDGHQDFQPTPVLVEEDPWYFVNNLSGYAGSHVGGDATSPGCRIARTHFGGGNYASIDQSVQRFNEPPTNEGANRWESAAPSGKWTKLGMDVKWGWWNRQ